MNDKLFFLVWRNIYIRKFINKYVQLYKINKYKIFKNRKQLLEYRFREYIQTIEYSNNVEELLKGDLPEDHVLEKVIVNSISVIKSNDIIPNTVKIKEISLPIILTDIILGGIPRFFNSIINIGTISYDHFCYFHNNLVKLDFGHFSRFNLKLESNLLPVSLTFLNLGSEWNNDNVPLKIGDLSTLINLRVLKISNYKQELTYGVLPINKSLIKLKVGEYSFQEDTTNIDQNFENWVIPITVKNLTIIDNFESKIGLIITDNTIIPKSVTKLKLFSKQIKIKANSIPNSVTHLEIGNIIQKSPIICKDILPSSLKTLIVTGSSFQNNEFKIQHDALSNLNNLRKFQVKQNLPICISSSIGNWDKPIYKGFFPSSLTSIDLGPNFNYKIENDVLPCNLLELKFGHYNHPLPKLPSSLTSLYFKGSFNQTIEIGSLPDSITYLNLSSSYKKRLDPNVLPKSLLTFYPKELLNNK